MLKAVVADLQTVEEGHRGFYVEKDGKFVLNVTPTDGFELDNVSGLKSALGAERKAKSDLAEAMKAYEGLDAKAARAALEATKSYEGLPDAETIRTNLAAFETLSKFDPKSEAEKIAEAKIVQRETTLKGEFTKRETQLVEELTSLKTVNEKREAQVKSLLIDNAIKGELAKLNPLDDARDAIELLARQAIQLKVDANGAYQVEILDAQGNPRVKDHFGNPLTVGEFLTEIRETRPGLFKPDPINGAGTKPGAGNQKPNTGAKNPWAKETFNLTEQMVLLNTNPTQAAQLKAQAGVE